MSAGSVVAFAPGRVNLIGEHTDYNGGLALPFAIDCGVTVRATALPGPLMLARATDLRETDAFDARLPGPAAGWRAFVRGTVAELTATGFRVLPARVEISGTVPRGGGLASSAALGAALALALCGERNPDRRSLARVCSRVENEWVGAQTGMLDQYAALFSRAGEALRIDFARDTLHPVPVMLGGWRLVVVSAGTPRDLADCGYDERRRECSEAAERLGVDCLRWAAPAGAEALDEPWRSRALHVLGENERVERAVAALRAGDPAALGPLLDASHASLRDRFEVSTPEVEATIAGCRAAGAAGARLIGGGFGGHVLALLPPGCRPPHGALPVAPSAGAYIRNTP